jgi:tetratricopeptide (TPR) repeat protein
MLRKIVTSAERRNIDIIVCKSAADYLDYLFQNERRNLPQAILVHQAWRRAGENVKADRLALDVIIGPLNRQGLYQTLLAEWLPDICQSDDLQIRAEALGQTGKQHLHLGNYQLAHPYFEQSLKIRQEIGDKSGEGNSLNNISQIFQARGDYDTALTYLQQSLKIRQEIGDMAGLCATLFNMGHIHAQNEAMDQAVGAWVTVYRLAQPRGLAQALAALAKLAPRLGLPPGLDGWEALARRMGQEGN